ncbi:type VI secretion system contractile sheath small subunit [Azospirillum sp. TSO22-1]|uniref:type VI secretion system contractile sheath small subunit n=1 Tax=Azospirillum sp. TSO22-1 TaxID=716789 RepID=UPI000D608348|nr:type VI secretion system contractile sheath small subunit [Azospirillum sp. TSO22-1]PWC54494.1 type VI secretion protein [Azospirillum sp. TSO22-1]
MAESTQHKLSRVRPPRVQITYDVEIGNAIEKKELPYIVGIMADLSGKPAEALPPVKDRKFIEIDRDNFQDVLSAINPRVAFRVPNKLQPDSNDFLNVELKFKHLDDFGPVEVLKQVPQLKRLFEARSRLRDLLTKLDGNDDLDGLLKQVMASTEDQEALKKQLSAPAGDAAAPAADAPKAE